jgi:hypothetical protein
MKFESKYLVRWGIPGWVFLTNVIIIYGMDYSSFFNKILTNNPVQLVGIIIGIFGIGVPIGYMIHQMYFLIYWIRKKYLKFNLNYITELVDNFPYPEGWTGNRQKDYFYIEYLWQSKLSKLEESRMRYISERYRHLLSTTHSLGALLFSLSFSFGVAFVEMFSNLYLLIIMIILITLTFIVGRNFFYYSFNSMYFQGKFLNELIDEESKNKK